MPEEYLKGAGAFSPHRTDCDDGLIQLAPAMAGNAEPLAAVLPRRNARRAHLRGVPAARAVHAAARWCERRWRLTADNLRQASWLHLRVGARDCREQLARVGVARPGTERRR